jgi:hypothetical protein
MTEQNLAESRPLGGSNFDRSDRAVGDAKYLPTISTTYFHNVLRDMLLEELKDL